MVTFLAPDQTKRPGKFASTSAVSATAASRQPVTRSLGRRSDETQQRDRRKRPGKIHHGAFAAPLIAAAPALGQDGEIVRDGAYRFIEAQHAAEWGAQDERIEARLAEIREAQGGKRADIFYILIDDVSFGLMGQPAMNYVTGIDTSNINAFATEGMSLMRMYAEPSCTPTRTALLTGRHPIRAGVEEVKVALVGKWHQGDIVESYPHNQGFDRADFPLHQQVQLSFMTKEAAMAGNMAGFHSSNQSGEFAIDKLFKPYGLVTGLETEATGTAVEVGMEAGEEWSQAHYVEMDHHYQRQTLAEEPFFLQC